MKKKFSLNHHVICNVVTLLLISITLASSTFILPLAYSQQSSSSPRISTWRTSGEADIRLLWPSGVGVDPSSGNVYAADTGNSRIQVFSSNGTFLETFGQYGAGNGSLRSPEGVAVDPSSGNVYVADTGNHRIQVFSSNGTFLERFGQYGVADGRFRSPSGVAVDPSSGNVYVVETGGNRIQVFSSNGTFLETFGRFGDQDGRFRSPEGVAVDQQGNVYVADTGNSRIQVFSSNGTFLEKLGGYGRNDTRMRFPQSVAVDQQENIYLADTANNRISAFSRPPSVNVSFSSEEGEIYGVDTRIKIESIYEGLSFPTAVGFLGPNDIVVVERQNNTIMRIVNGQMLDEPVLELANSTIIGSCVCDIAILQDDNNGTSYAFVYYAEASVTEGDGETKLVDLLYRYDIINGKFINPKLFFEMPTVSSALHNGGKLLIGPDKNIYLTIGDIDGRRTQAQNVKNGSLPDYSSAILRFAPDGGPVDGGPLGDTSPLNRYYAYGIRNSFGIDYDPLTGNIWITDNGPNYADELNLVRPGFNGGWREIMGFSSLDESFNLSNLEFFNGTGKYYDPTFEWLDSIGVTDLVFVPSDKLGKEYEGNLFVGDFNSGYLYRFLLNETRTGLLLNGSLSDGIANNNLETLLVAFAKINGGGITDLEVGPDGLIYIASSNGKIMRLEPMDTNSTLSMIGESNIT